MCCTEQRVKLFCLGILSRALAGVGRILHRNLDRLNSVWYRFSIYCLVQVSRWPNQAPQRIGKGNLFENHQSKFKRNLGMRMDTCEILIVLLFIIMAVVPLAIVMTIVELLNKRKMEMQQRNRVGSRRIINSVSMSTL